MNDRLDLLVTDWLRADAPAEASPRTLEGALARVATASQERYVTQRLLGDRIGRRRDVRLALVLGLLLLAIAGAFGDRRRAPPRAAETRRSAEQRLDRVPGERRGRRRSVRSGGGRPRRRERRVRRRGGRATAPDRRRRRRPRHPDVSDGLPGRGAPRLPRPGLDDDHADARAGARGPDVRTQPLVRWATVPVVRDRRPRRERHAERRARAGSRSRRRPTGAWAARAGRRMGRGWHSRSTCPRVAASSSSWDLMRHSRRSPAAAHSTGGPMGASWSSAIQPRGSSRSTGALPNH